MHIGPALLRLQKLLSSATYMDDDSMVIRFGTYFSNELETNTTSGIWAQNIFEPRQMLSCCGVSGCLMPRGIDQHFFYVEGKEE